MVFVFPEKSRLQWTFYFSFIYFWTYICSNKKYNAANSNSSVGNRAPVNKQKPASTVQTKILNGTNDTPNSKVLLLLLSTESQAINSSNSVLKQNLVGKLKGNSKVWQRWKDFEDFLWWSKTKAAKRAAQVILNPFVLPNIVVIKFSSLTKRDSIPTPFFASHTSASASSLFSQTCPKESWPPTSPSLCQ